MTAKKGLELILDIAPDIPRYAVIDPLRVSQILINLLSNAAKFTEQGQVNFKLSYTMLDGDHAELEFTVRDTGIGIKRQQQKQLFKAFAQLDSSTTRKYGGTGLGLTISSHLAQMMNSNIDFKSKDGMGSTFSFAISARVEREAMESIPVQTPIKRALIIDDNRDSLMVIENYLQYLGIECETCSSGLQALDYFREGEAFDVVFVDLHMPNLDGIGAVQMIRSQFAADIGQTAFVLMHSSPEDNRSEQECHDLGFRFSILKPIKPSLLLKILQKIDSKQNIGDKAMTAISRNDNEPLSMISEPVILIAEDNPLNLTLLKEMIRQQIPGARIIAAGDGIQAIRSAREQDPDLILMDVQMPKLDGINATLEIRSTSSIPIIAITAGALKEEREKCLSAGMNDFLTKPVMAAELRETLGKYLESKLESNDTPKPKKESSIMHFDYKALLDNISQDHETLLSLLEIVEKTFPEKLGNLGTALDDANTEDVLAILHSIRGSAQNMHFGPLAAACSKLEKSYPQIGPEEAANSYAEIMQRWDALKGEIAEYKGH